MWFVILAQLLLHSMHTLTVIHGSGSGRYECGTKVTIVAERKRGYDVQWHSHWDGTGIESVHQRKTVLTMPCHAVKVEAVFTPKPR